MIKSKLHAKNLRSVFANGAQPLLHAHIARLCVLFEDLRIETYGIIAESLPTLDFTDKAYRGNYFLRRSIATVFEFAEELRLLNELDDFQRIKSSFDESSVKRWTKAVKFFGRYEGYFQRIRNDIGGHFGLKAAIHSISDLPADYLGMIEIVRGGKDGAGIKLQFAGQIATSAMFRHKAGHGDDYHVHRLLRLTRAGYRHSIRAVNSIANFYLWDRFA